MSDNEFEEMYQKGDMVWVDPDEREWVPAHAHASLTEKMERLEGDALPEVEDCANWLEVSIVQGGHCYNCASRDGYPWRARPSEACTRFSLLTAEEQE